MTLREQNQLHAADGGAYYRTAWTAGTYWRYNARPTSLQSGMTGIDETVPTSQGNWVGSLWTAQRPFWMQAYISPTEAQSDDWNWISQIQILNITNRSASDPIAPTNVMKQLNEPGLPGEPLRPEPLEE